MDATMLRTFVLGASAVTVIFIWRKLYPKPYPGIPYVEASAQRISGDIPHLMEAMKLTDEATNSMFAISTQKLGTPIAQVLFPGFARPLITVDDPIEVEDIVVRRQKEFDKSPMAVQIFEPMFPHGSLSQFTTPKLKEQKRLWADVMKVDFLRKAAGPKIYTAMLEVLELWHIKASSIYEEKPFSVIDDFKNATLDVIWASLVGNESGIMRFEIEKLKEQIASGKGKDGIKMKAPPSAAIKDEVAYVEHAIAKNARTPMPTWAQKLETYTPRYRKFRSTISSKISQAMKDSVRRYERLQAGALEDDAFDTCMMDLVLRRQILEAKKKGEAPTDPTKDQYMLDEMFIMLVGGHDSTANSLAWFLRFMELYPSVQKDLRTEVEAAFPQSKTPSLDQILDTNIPYLDAVCEESLRLAGTSKGNLRQAVIDTEILGCRIPKGAEVLLNLHINHPLLPVDDLKRSPSSKAAIDKHGYRLSDTITSSLSLFDPTRWLTRDQSTDSDVFNPYAVPSLAFGGGIRGCFGRKLATMEFRIAVVLLILNFEFLELPQELKSMLASEAIFRQPQKPFVRVKVL
ncbi:unnamed protein product [Clonostachys rosea f. rosea IK726]|uniref:Cytochrome P450 n=3 Tax=Bionectria ochroleuca TaxID=29856 RepID=A0A0B7K8M7_BIOOC|nr:unnamed protein product [Clonostachys rosea f. rosea IK726]